MGHIMIQNKGELPIWGIRLMGFSDKGADKIGRFGTGLKESIALLTRYGVQPIIFSGEMRMDFRVELLDNQEEICFKLSETRGRFNAGEWYGLGIHPNLGRHDWDDPWMIFREVVCNALDESGVDGLFHNVCYHDPVGTEGTTRFYIPETEHLRTAYETISDKLLPLGEFQIEREVTGVGRAIRKRKSTQLQLFHRGVWIQQSERDSLYDYEIDDIKLNESRSADWHSVNRQISRMIAHYTQEQAQDLLQQMLQEQKRDLYEADALQHASYYVELDTQIWTHAFHALYGEDAVMIDNNEYMYEKLKKLGKVPVVVTHSGLRDLLRAAGVPTPKKVLSREQRDWEGMEEASHVSHLILDALWDKLGLVGKLYGAEKPELRLFIEQAGKSSISFGNVLRGVVYVNKSIVGSTKERQTVLLCLAKHIIECGDETPELPVFLTEIADQFMNETPSEPVCRACC